jgi:hypothetical protein
VLTAYLPYIFRNSSNFYKINTFSANEFLNHHTKFYYLICKPTEIKAILQIRVVKLCDKRERNYTDEHDRSASQAYNAHTKSTKAVAIDHPSCVAGANDDVPGDVVPLLVTDFSVGQV